MSPSLKFRTTAVDIKSTSNAVWWIKNPSRTWAQKQRKQSLSASFGQDFVDLFRNVSLHGYNKFSLPELNLWEKLIWLAVHVTALVLLFVVLSLTWEQFVAQYIVINLHDPNYPVEKVPFPAVSICSNNRISLQAATQYANELRQKDPTNRSVNYFLQRIRHFGKIYYKYSANVPDDLLRFQAFLDTYDTLDNETFYNTRRNMQKLTPSCKDLILKCMLAGKQIECFSNKTFQDSLTMYGPCCTFNLEDSYRQRSLENSFVNSNLGLTVILNNSRDDDFYSILNIDGYVVIIHNPVGFADIASGSSQEVFPTHGEESFLSIKARIIDTDTSLRTFDPSTRKCYFDDEAPDPELLILKTYRFNNCITRCRIRSILALCNCLPFYMPLDLLDNSVNGMVFCTLQHIECLLRYTFKWGNVLTARDPQPGLEHAIEEALYCPQCLPSCEDVQYQVSLMSLPTDRYRASIYLEQTPHDAWAVEDMSVLRVHFGAPYSQYYRRVVGNSWYEAFSTIGNVSSIFIGFSMVAIFEILFFVVKYLLIAVKRFLHHNGRRERARKGDNLNEVTLYICP